MKTYYIYHIEGVKVGCTSDLQKRMADQGFTSWNILEEHTDIIEASNREIQLQKEYGLPVDDAPYWQSVQNRRRFTKADMSKGGRNSTHNSSKPGKASKEVPRRSLRFLTFEQAEEIRSKYIPRKYSCQTLANEYGVNINTIQQITRGQTYIRP